MAVELEIPQKQRQQLGRASHSLVRYEVSIGIESDSGVPAILAEKVLLKRPSDRAKTSRQLTFFPAEPTPRESLISPRAARNAKTVVNKVTGGNDNYYDETGKGWDHAFKLRAQRSALGNLPEDESKFPVATWLKGILTEGIQRLVLNSELMRNPSPPLQPKGFRPDGSNLPWVVEGLLRNHPDKHRDWVEHVQTALPDIADIRTVDRPEDRHRYLVLHYRDGLEVPSWTASDGTLRLLALTLPAYLVDLEGVFLIEEPENGIHPRAVETALQSLSSVYGAQVLLASHSPVIVSIVEPSAILCFARTEGGAAALVRGTEHPALRDWKSETNLGVLFAGGVLG